METHALQSRLVTALSIADSPSVFLVKCLLFPAISVLTLVLCLKLLAEPLKGGHLLIAVLAFLGASEFLGLARIGSSDIRRSHLYQFLDVVARWFALLSF